MSNTNQRVDHARVGLYQTTLKTPAFRLYIRDINRTKETHRVERAVDQVHILDAVYNFQKIIATHRSEFMLANSLESSHWSTKDLQMNNRSSSGLRKNKSKWSSLLG